MPPNIRNYRIVQLVIVLILGSFTAAQAQDEARFIHWMYRDVGALASQVTVETPFYFTGGAIVLLSASSFDRQFSRHVDGFDEGAFSSFFDSVNELGGSKIVYPAAGLFATSLVFGSRRFQDAAFTSLQSLVYSQILVSGIKSVSGRFRPYRGEGPFEFDPFSEHLSFPSGHTAAAFALTVPWAVYYPNVVTYGLVGASVGTAVARMAQRKHWLTDVVAGGTMAGLLGYWLARHHLRMNGASHLLPDNVFVTPAVGRNAVLVQFRIGL